MGAGRAGTIVADAGMTAGIGAGISAAGVGAMGVGPAQPLADKTNKQAIARGGKCFMMAHSGSIYRLNRLAPIPLWFIDADTAIGGINAQPLK